MEYYIEDFTEENYRHLLKSCINKKFILYPQCQEFSEYILWRHDVDFSVHRAYALAIIEQQEGVQSTFFIQIGSWFYNIFETEVKKLIFKIKDLGHDIALHFDPTQYSIKTKDDLEKHLTFEKNILEQLFDIEVNAFSFHNPNPEILSYDEYEYAGMINTYANYFKKNVDYCSDSNGYWRFKRLEDFLEEDHTRSQVLTHPAWWQKEVLKPRQRIQRCIDGKKKSVENYYDDLLIESRRDNVK